MPLRIYYLADKPEYIAPLATHLKEQWGKFHPERNLKDWESELHLNKDKFPLTLIALNETSEEVKLVGTAALRVGVHPEISTSSKENTLWLERVYVNAEERQRGIAAALVNRCIKLSQVMQIDKKPIRELLLLTRNADRLYIKFGWKETRKVDYKGGPVSLMTREIVPKYEKEYRNIVCYASLWKKAPDKMQPIPSLQDTEESTWKKSKL